jgi:mono/diheme cytochrome c family protein
MRSWQLSIAPAALHAARAAAQPPPMSRAPAFRAADLAAQPRDGWLTNGGSLANQRYSPLTTISRDNVADLRDAMPAFGRALRPDDLHDVAAYVLEQLVD